MSQTQTSTAGTKPGRTLSIIGAVLGVLALVVLPIVLGPIGAVDRETTAYQTAPKQVQPCIPTVFELLLLFQ